MNLNEFTVSPAGGFYSHSRKSDGAWRSRALTFDPNVTQRLRALETGLKTSLFLRMRQGMVLTPEGEALWQYCLSVQELAGETLAKINQEVDQTPVQMVISGSWSVMQSRVVSQVVPVIKHYSNLLLTLDIDDHDTQQHNLRNGLCQLAILAKRAGVLWHANQVVSARPVCVSRHPGLAASALVIYCPQ